MPRVYVLTEEEWIAARPRLAVEYVFATSLNVGDLFVLRRPSDPSAHNLVYRALEVSGTHVVASTVFPNTKARYSLDTSMGVVSIVSEAHLDALTGKTQEPAVSADGCAYSRAYAEPPQPTPDWRCRYAFATPLKVGDLFMSGIRKGFPDRSFVACVFRVTGIIPNYVVGECVHRGDSISLKVGDIRPFYSCEYDLTRISEQDLDALTGKSPEPQPTPDPQPGPDVPEHYTAAEFVEMRKQLTEAMGFLWQLRGRYEANELPSAFLRDDIRSWLDALTGKSPEPQPTPDPVDKSRAVELLRNMVDMAKRHGLHNHIPWSVNRFLYGK